jgi:hypothetical protein
MTWSLVWCVCTLLSLSLAANGQQQPAIATDTQGNLAITMQTGKSAMVTSGPFFSLLAL